MKKNQKTGRLGRNARCRCGSGKKYKECCLPADLEKKEAALWAEAGRRLSRRLNKGPQGGSANREQQGFRLWGGLRSSGGREIPELPEQPLGNPTLFKIIAGLKKKKKKGSKDVWEKLLKAIGWP